MSSFGSYFYTSFPAQPQPRSQSPPHESKKTLDAIARGETLIQRAVLAERSDSAEALHLYTEALSIWVEIMRVEADEDKKKSLSKFIDHYMQRAEAMKTIVNHKEKDRSDFKNYNHPTRSSTARKVATQSRQVHHPRPGASAVIKRAQPRPTVQPAASGKSEANEYETQMLSEMLDSSPGVRWSDISGLQYAKRTIHEAVVMPHLRPDLFSGLRSPPKGVLFYGPPGAFSLLSFSLS